MKQEKFNKMIDKYYGEKLKEYFINFLASYNIDKKFYMTRNNIEMLIKNRKWKEDFYILVFSIPYEECFKFFVSDYEMDKLKDNVIELIREKIERR